MIDPTPPDHSEPCADPARALLDFHLNGTLSPEEDARVRAHLDACARCATECAELAEVTAAIARFGLEPSPASGRTGRRWRFYALAAALVLAAALGLYMARARGGPMASAPAAGDLEARLDLGRGATRNADSIPVVVVTPGLRSVRVTLFPPVQPGARYLASLSDSGGEAGPEIPAGAPDTLGRTEIVFPASRLQHAGPAEVVLRVVPEAGEARTFRYPFVIVRSDDRP
ncbi:MAG TPA: zf-HC2 domain-containing protein [Dongiaceae bacterium]|nr:zf-HC2 domain-containing protein [Dongiaceae bacterium]